MKTRYALPYPHISVIRPETKEFGWGWITDVLSKEQYMNYKLRSTHRRKLTLLKSFTRQGKTFCKIKYWGKTSNYLKPSTSHMIGRFIIEQKIRLNREEVFRIKIQYPEKYPSFHLGINFWKSKLNQYSHTCHVRPA